MSITNWDVHDRPREKLLHMGASSLSDAELLAIFLRVGVQGQSAVDLAHALIRQFGSLSRLFAAPQNELTEIKGMGSAKYAQLQAVFEMSRRALADSASQNTAIEDLSALKTLIQLHFRDCAHERCIVLYLDPALRLIHIDTLFEGTLTTLDIDLRALTRSALAVNAHALILAHNHPNGSNQPSESDILSTRTMQNQLLPMGLHLIDHFIVADGSAPFSMAEHQLIAQFD